MTTTMTREEMIDKLVEHDVDNFDIILRNWTLDKVPPYLDIKCVQIKETCINQILVCS